MSDFLGDDSSFFELREFNEKKNGNASVIYGNADGSVVDYGSKNNIVNKDDYVYAKIPINKVALAIIPDFRTNLIISFINKCLILQISPFSKSLLVCRLINFLHIGMKWQKQRQVINLVQI